MKKLLLILFLIPFYTMAQEEFSFELYFEDALGKKDTVILGYDALATDTIDANFGEVDILNVPWGNGLDVRVGNLVFINNNWAVIETDSNGNRYGNSNFSTNELLLTKKQILAPYCDGSPFSPLYASSTMSIQFYSANYPIIIRWNKQLFNNMNCINNSMFCGNNNHLQPDVAGIRLLSTVDSLVIETDSSYVFEDKSLPSFTQGSMKINLIQFNFMQSSTANVDNLVSNEFTVFPNPVSVGGELHVGFNCKYLLINMLGETIQEGAIENKLIPIKTIKSGIYILLLETDNNRFYTQKIFIQ